MEIVDFNDNTKITALAPYERNKKVYLLPSSVGILIAPYFSWYIPRTGVFAGVQLQPMRIQPSRNSPMVIEFPEPSNDYLNGVEPGLINLFMENENNNIIENIELDGTEWTMISGNNKFVLIFSGNRFMEIWYKDGEKYDEENNTYTISGNTVYLRRGPGEGNQSICRIDGNKLLLRGMDNNIYTYIKE